MKKNPLFSILMANYNNGMYIGSAIESVMRQTYTHWEIVLVEDNSTDNSMDVIQSYINDGVNIRLFRNEVNRGCGATKKRCAELANGELCGFLDPDDILLESAIERTVLKHLEVADAALVYTQTMLCDSNLQPIGLSSWGGILPENESQMTAKPGQKIVPFAAFKKSNYVMTAGIDKSYKRAVDQDLYYKLEETGRIYYIEEPLYYYRRHDNNISLNENNIKARYWLYKVNKDTYYRRKKSSIKTKNILYGELQRQYLDVCLLKIDQKIRTKVFQNVCYYYFQVAMRIGWDKNGMVLKKHIFFLKRFLLKIFRK